MGAEIIDTMDLIGLAKICQAEEKASNYFFEKKCQVSGMQCPSSKIISST